MYDNQNRFREFARMALERQGYNVKVLIGGGARLEVTKNGESAYVLVRTSSDRWLGWMRRKGEWLGLDKAELVVVVVADHKRRPTKVEIYALDPAHVRRALTKNLAAREAHNPTLSKSAPIFVCMDLPKTQGPAATGGNLKALALWSVELPLNGVSRNGVSSLEQFSPAPTETRESFAARVRREFAALIGVPVEKVSVDFRVTL